jgi:hypothetical protein
MDEFKLVFLGSSILGSTADKHIFSPPHLITPSSQQRSIPARRQAALLFVQYDMHLGGLAPTCERQRATKPVSKPQNNGTVHPLNAHTQQQSQTEYTPESLCLDATMTRASCRRERCIAPWHQPCLACRAPRPRSSRGSRS